MLQRIQTIWLLAAGIAALLTIKLPTYTGSQSAAVPYLELNGNTGGFLILIITVFVAVLSLVTVALFKNRTTQLRLCAAAILIEILLLVLYYLKIKDFTQGTFALTSVLHIAVILFLVLAARGINNDEKLIKESDRLR